MSLVKKAKKYIGRSFQEVWKESFGVIGRSGKALCILCTEIIGRSVIV